MFCQNNLLTKKFNLNKIKNVHFSFIPLSQKKKNHRFSQNAGDLENGNSRYLSSVQSLSTVTCRKPGKESIYQSVAGSQSRYISDDHWDNTRIQKIQLIRGYLQHKEILIGSSQVVLGLILCLQVSFGSTILIMNWSLVKYITSCTNKHTSSVELSPEKNFFLGLCW